MVTAPRLCVLLLTTDPRKLICVSVYKRYGADTISTVPLLYGSAKIWSANLDMARQVVGGGPSSPWFKPPEFSQLLLCVPSLSRSVWD